MVYPFSFGGGSKVYRFEMMSSTYITATLPHLMPAKMPPAARKPTMIGPESYVVNEVKSIVITFLL